MAYKVGALAEPKFQLDQTAKICNTLTPWIRLSPLSKYIVVLPAEPRLFDLLLPLYTHLRCPTRELAQPDTRSAICAVCMNRKSAFIKCYSCSRAIRDPITNELHVSALVCCSCFY